MNDELSAISYQLSAEGRSQKAEVRSQKMDLPLLRIGQQPRAEAARLRSKAR
jgi:hypothetical protein